MATETTPAQGLRRLVTVETIADITAIPGADAIEAARVRSWTVVVRKGQFAVGDPVVYIEVDAALPVADERFSFLADRGTKENDGVAVHVLRTARLRGVYSQGIAFPLDDFPELRDAADGSALDVLIGVVKWEPALPPGTAAIGPFPAFLQKSDAERVQNLDDAVWAEIQADAESWRPTEKVDGTSLSAWRTGDGVFHFAGRNWELDPAASSPYRNAAGVAVLADRLGVGEWIQGEVAGPGVQGNPLKLDALCLVLFGFGTFDARDPSLVTTTRTPLGAWPEWADALRAPVYDLALPGSIAEAIAQVEKLGSLLAPTRAAEGIVWTHADGMGIAALGDRPVWKSISAHYLTKHGG